LRELRLGKFDVLVGINLLREGLDLPEVALVAVLDADKEGFLRSGTSLVQTIGRAARNLRGKVILYADLMTDSIRHAVDQTNRRRAVQTAYNREHGITPRSVEREVTDIMQALRVSAQEPATVRERARPASREDVLDTLRDLEEQMLGAAQRLEFELAATLRDEIRKLRKDL